MKNETEDFLIAFLFDIVFFAICMCIWLYLRKNRDESKISDKIYILNPQNKVESKIEKDGISIKEEENIEKKKKANRFRTFLNIKDDKIVNTEIKYYLFFLKANRNIIFSLCILGTFLVLPLYLSLPRNDINNPSFFNYISAGSISDINVLTILFFITLIYSAISYTFIYLLWRKIRPSKKKTKKFLPQNFTIMVSRINKNEINAYNIYKYFCNLTNNKVVSAYLILDYSIVYHEQKKIFNATKNLKMLKENEEKKNIKRDRSKKFFQNLLSKKKKLSVKGGIKDKDDEMGIAETVAKKGSSDVAVDATVAKKGSADFAMDATVAKKGNADFAMDATVAKKGSADFAMDATVAKKGNADFTMDATVEEKRNKIREDKKDNREGTQIGRTSENAVSKVDDAEADDEEDEEADDDDDDDNEEEDGDEEDENGDEDGDEGGDGDEEDEEEKKKRGRTQRTIQRTMQRKVQRTMQRKVQKMVKGRRMQKPIGAYDDIQCVKSNEEDETCYRENESNMIMRRRGKDNNKRMERRTKRKKSNECASDPNNSVQVGSASEGESGIGSCTGVGSAMGSAVGSGVGSGSEDCRDTETKDRNCDEGQVSFLKDTSDDDYGLRNAKLRRMKKVGDQNYSYKLQMEENLMRSNNNEMLFYDLENLSTKDNDHMDMNFKKKKNRYKTESKKNIFHKLFFFFKKNKKSHWKKKLKEHLIKFYSIKNETPKKSTGVCFVSFIDTKSVHDCIHNIPFTERNKWVISNAPPNYDIIWKNLKNHSYKVCARFIILNALLLLANAIIIITVTYIDNILKLRIKKYRGADPSSGNLSAILTTWLSPFIVIFVNSIIQPALITCVSIAIGFIRKSSEHTYVLQGNFIFLILNTIIIPLLSLSPLSSLIKVMYSDEIGQWSTRLGAYLFNSSAATDPAILKYVPEHFSIHRKDGHEKGDQCVDLRLWLLVRVQHDNTGSYSDL
ncbi:conserved Plasmodium membrane protein, unknown function [Plasmodium ovale curtisi]|uniref:CSC1/OSCA1-like cytosolic domain-containing protein n=1 Tax=Plasmodium ovale curtisi TaxID=864141 RepID=A0A1A8X3C9_PLAOA|nr:conserved Plasmodium membrane protein, unknown function [Plasmodium ovale curtisi]